MMKWAGLVGLVGETRSTYEVMVGNHETKTPLRRPKHTWEGVHWILRKLDERAGNRFIWLRRETNGGLL